MHFINLNRKGRRKADKDPPTSDGTPGPPYLDPAGARFPTQFVTPALLPAYVRLPYGVDQDEWLATHSKHTYCYFYYDMILCDDKKTYLFANQFCLKFLCSQRSHFSNTSTSCIAAYLSIVMSPTAQV